MAHILGKVRRRQARHPVSMRPGGDAVRRALRAGDIQAKLKVGAENDAYEREADAVAAHVMTEPRFAAAMPASAPALQRLCADCEEEGGGHGEVKRQTGETQVAKEIQPKVTTGKSFAVSPAVESAVSSMRGAGHPLPGGPRAFYEGRFGADFSSVRVHTGAKAAQAAGAINASAFTSGRDIVFAEGEYVPESRNGGMLLAHELTHVLQQRRGAPAMLRRATQRLRHRPAAHTPPCACLVFVHGNERSARRAIENLHANCRYNLAIIDRHRHGRHIRFTGRRGSVDPNELFPAEIRTECEGDLAGCRSYADDNDNLRATQIAFYLAIRDCSDGFALPVVALHNNTIGDTATYRGVELDEATLGGLPGTYHAEATEEGQLTRDDLIDRLRAHGGNRRGAALVRMTGAARTTNIYRWCNLPEIGRCHVGDPANPDDVIWTVRSSDFDRLAHRGLNVVQQTRASEGGESDTDLSTLFLNVPNARYINIETPHRRPGEDDPTSRRNNMIFVLRALLAAGLACCDVGRGEETSDE